MSEREYVEHRAGLNSLQLGRCIDEPLIPGATEANQDGDILFAVDREGHRWRIDASPGVEVPELLQCLGVERHDLARGLAREDQVGCREYAAQIREWRFKFDR